MPPDVLRPPSLAAAGGTLALCVLLTLCVLWAAGSPTTARAQADTTATADTARTYGSGMGTAVVLTNSGFGLGGYLSYAFEPTTAAVVEVRLSPGKDPREASFFDRFGQRDIPRKANYLLLAPVHIGFRQRLLRNHIEDNFRPFLQLSGGPTFGWSYPYFEDENANRQLDDGERVYGTFAALGRGEPRLGVSSTLALGAFFGSSTSAVRAVRIGYEATYFFEGVQLLEPQVQEARRYFGTPTITLLFGRLF